MSAMGASRHFAAMRNSAAIGAKWTLVKPHQSSLIYEYAPWLPAVLSDLPDKFAVSS